MADSPITWFDPTEPLLDLTVVLRGFDRDEVHGLARCAVDALVSNDRDTMAAAECTLRQARPRVRFRGYEMGQVTAYLNRLADVLARGPEPGPRGPSGG